MQRKQAEVVPAQPAAVATSPDQAPQQEAAAQLDNKCAVQMTESGVGMQFGGVTVKSSLRDQRLLRP